jgi:hypothetical protein
MIRLNACPVCGLAYRDFRTGLSFRDIYDSLRALKRHKRRRSVLGHWHQIKNEMFAAHAARCGAADVETEFDAGRWEGGKYEI